MESSGSLPLGGVLPRKWPGQRGAAAPESGAWASVRHNSSPTESSPTFRLVDLRGVGLSTEEGENIGELSMPSSACLRWIFFTASHLTRCFFLGQCTSLPPPTPAPLLPQWNTGAEREGTLGLASARSRSHYTGGTQTLVKRRNVGSK